MKFSGFPWSLPHGDLIVTIHPFIVVYHPWNQRFFRIETSKWEDPNYHENMEDSNFIVFQIQNLNDNTSFDTHLRHNFLGPRKKNRSFLFLWKICMDIFGMFHQTKSPKTTNSKLHAFDFKQNNAQSLSLSSYQGQEPFRIELQEETWEDEVFFVSIFRMFSRCSWFIMMAWMLGSRELSRRNANVS